MKPIRVTFHYKQEVDFDAENPDHVEYVGLPKAIENRMSHGYITDVLELKDTQSVRLLQGIRENEKGERYSDYKDELGSMSGVYVVFWEDKGDNYQMRIESYENFTVSNKEMNNYVRSAYNV